MTAPRKSTARKTTTPSTRPSLNRKVTPRSEQGREEALNKGLAVSIDGRRYEVRVGEVSSKLARELRGYVGIGPLQLIASCATNPDIDLLAAFVWLARRCDGEVVAFDDVTVTYGQMLGDGFDMDLPDGDGDDDPEA